LRNTAEYPVTLDEKIATLKHCQQLMAAEEERDGVRFGDIRPLALQEMIDEFEARAAGIAQLNLVSASLRKSESVGN
jgi:hypothetical protein